jgi:hypothetical protein
MKKWSSRKRASFSFRSAAGMRETCKNRSVAPLSVYAWSWTRRLGTRLMVQRISGYSRRCRAMP